MAFLNASIRSPERDSGPDDRDSRDERSRKVQFHFGERKMPPHGASRSTSPAFEM